MRGGSDLPNTWPQSYQATCPSHAASDTAWGSHETLSETQQIWNSKIARVVYVMTPGCLVGLHWCLATPMAIYILHLHLPCSKATTSWPLSSPSWRYHRRLLGKIYSICHGVNSSCLGQQVVLLNNIITSCFKKGCDDVAVQLWCVVPLLQEHSSTFRSVLAVFWLPL